MEKSNSIKINEIPSKTWSWLKLNSSQFQIPSNFSQKEIAVQNLEESANFHTENLSSSEQKNANQTLKDSSLDELIKSSSKSQNVITISKDTKNPVLIFLDYAENEFSSSVQKIIVKENVNAELIFVCTSKNASSGASVISTEVFAEQNSNVKISKIQLLSSGFSQIDDTTFFCSDNSSASLFLVQLGAKEIFSSVHTNLNGYKSKFYSDTAYFCKENQNYDFNHVCHQIAQKTDCKMYINGALKDSAKKTYRGTIDFKNGCKGSTGDEQEKVLVLSKETTNNSIPVILCDEEDVQGEHGCSIGRLSNEILFYMESRGIDAKSAEKIIARAIVNAVLSKIPKDENVLKLSEDFLNKIFGDENESI